MTFNLANIYGTGVVEMHAGDDGFMMKLGSAGTDISLGRLLSAWEGFKNVSKVIDAKGLSIENNKILSTLNAINSFSKSGHEAAGNADLYFKQDWQIVYEDMAGNGKELFGWGELSGMGFDKSA